MEKGYLKDPMGVKALQSCLFPERYGKVIDFSKRGAVSESRPVEDPSKTSKNFRDVLNGHASSARSGDVPPPRSLFGKSRP